MPRTDRSVTILTGMIIAGLYVILLVGFTRESYMRRDASRHADAPAVWPVVHDVSKRVCRIDPPLCAGLLDGEARQSCLSAIETLRRLVSEPSAPLSLEGLRRAMAEEP